LTQKSCESAFFASDSSRLRRYARAGEAMVNGQELPGTEPPAVPVRDRAKRPGISANKLNHKGYFAFARLGTVHAY
jgi:hypothetical protein